jgi:hypothetical protein
MKKFILFLLGSVIYGVADAGFCLAFNVTISGTFLAKIGETIITMLWGALIFYIITMPNFKIKVKIEKEKTEG